MTVYEKNYKARLNEMLDLVIRKYGYEHENTVYFACIVEKYYDVPNYENRETIEKIFKGLVK